jgi:hypothetical protein
VQVHFRPSFPKLPSKFQENHLSSPEVPGLQRSLKLWHLVLYGIIIIQPTAPMGIYGVVSNIGHGHVATAVLIAMFAMMLTAVSYGRMARVYPQAGSAFSYVSEELHPKLGYVVGWAMLMDYILNPIICIIWCSQAARNVFPDVPYLFWVVVFALVSTFLNTRGIQTSSRVNAILAVLMSLVVVLFLGEGVHYIMTILHPSSADLIRPFYDPATFKTNALFHGTSVAVLTYIGFDGISTMAEYSHCHCADVLRDRSAVCCRGVCGADGLAGPSAVRTRNRRHRIRPRCGACGGKLPVPVAKRNSPGGQYGIGNRSAVWRCAPDVRYGQKPLAPPADFRCD